MCWSGLCAQFHDSWLGGLGEVANGLIAACQRHLYMLMSDLTLAHGLNAKPHLNIYIEKCGI